MFKRILVPLDGHTESECALSRAVSMARLHNADLVLVRVPGNPIREYLETDPWVVEDVRHHMRIEAQAYVRTIAQTLTTQGFKVATYVEHGPVAGKILEIATRTRADLIIMAAYQRSALSRLVLGSVADAVAHDARLPVLLVKPNP
jgi:nucleotide-binding universal stress UspA family protein